MPWEPATANREMVLHHKPSLPLTTIVWFVVSVFVVYLPRSIFGLLCWLKRPLLENIGLFCISKFVNIEKLPSLKVFVAWDGCAFLLSKHNDLLQSNIGHLPSRTNVLVSFFDFLLAFESQVRILLPF